MATSVRSQLLNDHMWYLMLWEWPGVTAALPDISMKSSCLAFLLFLFREWENHRNARKRGQVFLAGFRKSLSTRHVESSMQINKKGCFSPILIICGEKTYFLWLISSQKLEFLHILLFPQKDSNTIYHLSCDLSNRLQSLYLGILRTWGGDTRDAFSMWDSSWWIPFTLPYTYCMYPQSLTHSVYESVWALRVEAGHMESIA